MSSAPLVWRVGVWVSATAMALLFAHTTRFGPAIHMWGTHGIHLGDLLAFGLAYGWAAIVAPPWGGRGRQGQSS